MTKCPNCGEEVYNLNDHYYESGSGMGHYNCRKKEVEIKRKYDPNECPSCFKYVRDPSDHYYESGSGMGHYRCS